MKTKEQIQQKIIELNELYDRIEKDNPYEATALYNGHKAFIDALEWVLNGEDCEE
jgi:hypothetical protein